MPARSAKSMHSALDARTAAFRASPSGSASVQYAIYFAIGGVALALLGAPLMQFAGNQYAANGGYGIDRMTTATVDKPTRYTIRRSVLSSEQIRICADSGRPC